MNAQTTVSRLKAAGTRRSLAPRLFSSFRATGVLLAFVFATLSAHPALAKSDPCQGKKQPVVSLSADQPLPYPGETVHLSSDITSDSPIASYEWKANGMQWEAGGPTWTYTVPVDKQAGQQINVHLKVRDTCGKVTQEHLKLQVVASDDDEGDDDDDEGDDEGDDDDLTPALGLRTPPAKSLRITLGSSLTGPRPSTTGVIDWRVPSPERQRELDRAYARRLR